MDLIICNNSAKFEEYQILVSFLLYEILGAILTCEKRPLTRPRDHLFGFMLNLTQLSMKLIVKCQHLCLHFNIYEQLCNYFNIYEQSQFHAQLSCA